MPERSSQDVQVRVVMLHYCDSLKQMRALWLARIAVSVYWWADLKASTLIPTKALLGTGTSFRSRSWSTAAPIRNVKAMLLPLAIIILSLVAFVGGCLHLRTNINLPTVLSLCAVAINFVPPFLLLLFWTFGPGRLLSRACTFFMLLSCAAGVAALVFLWLLFPRDVDFKRAAVMSLSFFDAQRSGSLPKGYPVQWRADSGEQNIYPIQFSNMSTNTFVNVRADLTGGFYNDGEVGPVKVTWNIALTTTMLAWSLLEYEPFWSKDEATKNHAIALLTHGLKYVQSTYVMSPLRDEFGAQQSPSFDKLVYVVRSPLPAPAPVVT